MGDHVGTLRAAIFCFFWRQTRITAGNAGARRQRPYGTCSPALLALWQVWRYGGFILLLRISELLAPRFGTATSIVTSIVTSIGAADGRHRDARDAAGAPRLLILVL